MTEIVNQIPEFARLPDSLDKDGYPDQGLASRAANEADFLAPERGRPFTRAASTLM